MGVSGGPNMIDDGLVLALDASDRNSYPGSGTTWRDLTANNFTGSLVNGPTFSSNNLGSIVFDGLDDYVLINSGSTILNPTSSITVSSFFNVTSYGANYAPIVFKQNNYADFYEQYVLSAGPSAIFFGVTGTDRVQRGALATMSAFGINVHAVGTCDTITDEIKIYINGRLITTGVFTSTFDIAIDTPVNIGGTGVLKFGGSFRGWTNGKIYNTRIYNRALSAQEVLQNYNALKSRFNL
jgi:hypothetical protein